MTSLPELQAGFAAALRGDGAAIAAEIAGDGLEPAARVSIYANNSRAMFEGALERTYPVLRRRVGEPYFRQLAHGYRQRYPSASGDLHWVGRHFPQYVADVQAGTGYEWLADLATLEWACESSMVAARQRPLAIEALAVLSSEEIADVRLRLQDSLHCVASSYPVLDVWRANQPDGDGRAVDLAKGAQYVLVSCNDAGPELLEVTAPALEFTRLLQQGQTLGEAMDRSDLPIESLAGALGRLFGAGLVAGLVSSSENRNT